MLQVRQLPSRAARTAFHNASVIAFITGFESYGPLPFCRNIHRNEAKVIAPHRPQTVDMLASFKRPGKSSLERWAPPF